MPRPGVDVLIQDPVVAAGPSLDSSQAFMVGNTERGPKGISTPVHGFQEYKKKYGVRNADTVNLYDAARAWFDEGGSTLYVSPYYGAAAVEATIAVGDMTATAVGPGVWGNNVDIEIVAPTSLVEQAMGGMVVNVLVNDVVVEKSPAKKTVADAVSWSMTSSNLVRLAATDPLDMDNPLAVVAKTSLAMGANDYTFNATTFEDAVNAFNYDLGPGQLSAPGYDDVPSQLIIGKHLDKTRRVAIVDLPDSNDPLEISSHLGGLYGQPGVEMMLAVGPRMVYPHEVPPAVTTVWGSGIESGIVSRVDKLRDRSLVAAGSDGISRRALGLAQDFDDSDREELNQLGAALFKDRYGQMRMYGFRTAAGPAETNWMFFQESRVIMQLSFELDAEMEEYVLKTIDGRNVLLSKINTVLTGVCLRYWTANALFGETPNDAFRVDTVSPNNIDTIKAGEVHGNVKVKTSRIAEWVEINLTKTMIDRPF